MFASLVNSVKLDLISNSLPNCSLNQCVNVPLVAKPAIEACSPSNNHGAYQRRGSLFCLRVREIIKIVDPYMHMVSPSLLRPIEIASAAASIVPVVTGIPFGRPVSDAAFSVTLPTISVDHFSSGKHSMGIISSVSSLLQF